MFFLPAAKNYNFFILSFSDSASETKNDSRTLVKDDTKDIHEVLGHTRRQETERNTAALLNMQNSVLMTTSHGMRMRETYPLRVTDYSAIEVKDGKGTSR